MDARRVALYPSVSRKASSFAFGFRIDLRHNHQLRDVLATDFHLRDYRLAKEEILYAWVRFVAQIVKKYFIMNGKPIKEEKLFQYRFPELLWENIETIIENLGALPLWVNRDLSATVFGGRQNSDYWQTIFEVFSAVIFIY